MLSCCKVLVTHFTFWLDPTSSQSRHGELHGIHVTHGSIVLNKSLSKHLLTLIWAFWQGVCLKLDARFAPGRIKHWLLLMQGRNPQADALLRQVRPLRTAADITRVLLAELARHLPGEASRGIVYRSSPTGSRNTDGGAAGESNNTPLAA